MRKIVMGDALKQRVKQTKFESSQQEALLNLLIAAHYVRQELERISSQYGITNGQYNVLRILKGAYPNGYPRYEIAMRMIEPAPDVTRLIDRLVKLGFVKRFPSEVDRRLSIAKITPKGMKLLDEMYADIYEFDNRFFSERLTHEDCEELSRICEQIYSKEK